ncbi:MAG: tetratricopeptide repeat protein, partial [Caulobacteraceae bacterium]
MIMLEVAALSVQADRQALYDAAVADRLGGRPAAAVPKLQQVLAAQADDVDARLNLGLALLALDRMDEAAAAFRDVIAQAPGYTDAYLGLARVEQRRGNLAAARLHAAEALRRAPRNQEALALAIALQARPMW